jgi:hypothetical protein
MPSGILGRADLAATTNTTVFTVPATKVVSATVSFCNRNATPITVRLAVAESGTPNLADWLLYDVIIDGNGSLEKTGIVADEAEQIVAFASGTGVSVMAYGFEE